MLAWTDHLPLILNEHIQIFHEDRREACEASGRLQYRGPEVKTTEARMALICASTDDGRPFTGGLNLI